MRDFLPRCLYPLGVPYLRFLLSLLVLLLLQPLAVDHGDEGLTLRQVVLSLVITGTLVLGTLASCTRRGQVITSICLALLTLVAIWGLPALEEAGGELTDTPGGLILAACPALFYFHAARLTLGFVMRGGLVTGERIFAALCVYLLVGFAFSWIYVYIEVGAPGSFHIPEESYALEPDGSPVLGPGGAPVRDLGWNDFVFFSFVTMTTLGYGDVTPLNDWARSLATLQTILAVFYMAVLIARLVSNYRDPTPESRDAGADDG